jgi:hypothetical protein
VPHISVELLGRVAIFMELMMKLSLKSLFASSLGMEMYREGTGAWARNRNRNVNVKETRKSLLPVQGEQPRDSQWVNI